MKYFSMFTGIGGFELGIQQAYELSKVSTKPKNSTDSKGEPSQHSKCPLCVGFSEIDKYASQLLQIKFPNTKNYGDATKINEHELPDFDLLVGGFPCQSFSIAGKRKGFADTRGTLFFDIARILAYKKPRNVLLENVKGLLSHDGGATFQTIIGVLSDLGYFVEWQVLNSKNFGVPQNRERVFIIGYLGGQPKSKVFPVGEDGNNVNGESGKELSSPQIARTITSTEFKQHGDGNYIKQINQPTHSNDRVYGEEGISPTLNTMQGGSRQPKISFSVNTKKGYAEAENGDGINLAFPNSKTRRGRVIKKNSPTLQTSAVGSIGTIQDMKIRRLTPLECERLQGFPDNWTKDFSDTQRYKMCGNAVTVNVVAEIINRLTL